MEEKLVPFKVIDLSRNHYRERVILLVQGEMDALNELREYYQNEFFHITNLRKELDIFCTSETFTLAFTVHLGHIVALGLFNQTMKGEGLPDAITKFPRLLELFLLNTIPEPCFKSDERPWRLEQLPSNIDDLMSLQVLKIRGFHSMNSLPGAIGNLHSLKMLDISLCGFSSFPNCIGALEELESLTFWAHKPKLLDLPESIGNLKSLQFLDLGENALQALPSSFAKLRSLKKLYLHNNQFSALPKSVCGLESLESLVMHHNQIEILPECIGRLSALKNISLSYNKLQSLPESIGSLHLLETLSIRNNNLRKLPKSIFGLPSLQFLLLVGNVELRLPQGVKKELENRSIEVAI